MTAETFIEQFATLAEAPNGVAKLCELILQLAVQGKLVPQDPNDEPADELLLRITLAKSEMVRRKTIGDRDSQPIGNDEIPFVVPDSWRWCRLCDIAHDLGQRTPEERFTYIDVGAINKERGVVSDDVQVLEANEAPSRARKIVAFNSVIYSTVRPYLLNVAVIETEFIPTPIVSTAFAVLHPHEGVVSRFIYHYLRSKSFVAYVESEMTGIAYPAINDGKMYRGLIPIPPLAEQRRIVLKVDQLLGLCDELAARQAARREARSALVGATLDRLVSRASNLNPRGSGGEGQHRSQRRPPHPQPFSPVSGGEGSKDMDVNRLRDHFDRLFDTPTPSKPLREIDDETPFEIPPSWSWARLGEICLNVTDGFHNTPKTQPSGVLYLTAQHVKPDGLNFDNDLFVSTADHQELVAKTRPKRGDVLVVNIGAGCGTPAIIDVDFEFSFKNVAILNRPAGVETNYLFIHLLGRQAATLDELTKGGAQPFLSLGVLRDTLVPLPPTAEQKRIVSKVTELLSLCDALEAKLTQAESASTQLLSAAVHHLLTGANPNA